ncbi:MAG: hypothetical protein ACRCT1_01495 [Microcoleaceae cyanobacterium]
MSKFLKSLNLKTNGRKGRRKKEEGRRKKEEGRVRASSRASATIANP